MKVAYFSPMPPERSGIADYSAMLVPELSGRIEIDVVRRGRKRPPRGADVCLYHVGNNPEAHGWIVDALRRRPGVVVLHDFVLHHLVAGMTIGRRDGHGYLDAMEREAGVVGRLLGHAVLDKRIPPLWENRPQDFHLAGEVLERATALIVHSRYVRDRARAAGYGRQIFHVPHPAWPDPHVEPVRIEGAPVFGAFGHINVTKRIPQLLSAFARVTRAHPDARLVLVGAESPGFDLDRRLQRLGADPRGVIREGFADEARLWSLITACDAVVSLRAPTMGETSGTAIRALVLGKPLVVSDIGWFSELPGDVALKVPADDDEVDILTAALELLVANAAVRSDLGTAARELARTVHRLDRVADLYVAALEEVTGGAAVEDAVLGDVARAASDVGIDPDAPEAAALARRLTEVELAE